MELSGHTQLGGRGPCDQEVRVCDVLSVQLRLLDDHMINELAEATEEPHDV